MEKIIFQETQKFGHNGIWFTILGIFLVTFYAFTQLVLMGVHQILLIAMIPSMTLLFYLLMLFRRFQLDTIVTPKAIEFRFFPTQKEFQEVEWQFIKDVDIREYSPFRHFGGWGARYGTTRAFTLGGNRGVEITFTNGKKLLLGSKRADELYRAIRQVMRK
jgi:hypothetical protein